MKILNCHIENFGRLHDYSAVFEEGLNIKVEKNGWGKSTFAAFIRAMFYGLDGDRKKSVAENERRRYRPWQGGIFGGRLDFETGQKRYSVTRIFGEKESQDSFELRDAVTGLLSEDYSRRLGEELFFIDRESFLRTVFIGQNDAQTAATDDINAMITDIRDPSGDIGSFDAAMARLSDAAGELSPDTSRGLIRKGQNEIALFERKVKEGEELPELIETYREKITLQEQTVEELEAQLKANTRLQQRQALLSKAVSDRQYYDRLRDRAEETEARRKRLRDGFPGALPDPSDVEREMIRACSMNAAGQRAGAYRLSGEERKLFAGLEEYYRQIKGENAVQENNSRTGGIRSGEPSDALIGNIAERVRKEEQAALKKAKSRKAGPLLILGIIFLTAGLAGLLFFRFYAQSPLPEQTLPAALLLSGFGAVWFILWGIACRRPSEADARPDKMADEVRSKLKKLKELKEKDASFREAEREYRLERQRSEDYLRGLGYVPEEDIMEQLIKIKAAGDAYAGAAQQAKTAREEFTGFERKLAPGTFEDAKEAEQLPDAGYLAEEAAQLNDKIARARAVLREYERNIEEAREGADELSESVSILKDLRKTQQEREVRYRRLCLAAKMMTKARNAITAEYAEPLLKSFLKYFSVISGNLQNEVHVDANSRVTVTEQGMKRDVETLSSGLKDLTGICLRMAMIDAMYKEEKPVIIMDDPFTNLDDDKVKAAGDFLEAASKDYQILYFTCSATRSYKEGA